MLADVVTQAHMLASERTRTLIGTPNIAQSGPPGAFALEGCKKNSWKTSTVRLCLFLDPNTTAIEHVLTFHSFVLSYFLSSSSLYHYWIIPKLIRPSLKLRSLSTDLESQEQDHVRIKKTYRCCYVNHLTICVFINSYISFFF